MKWDVRSIFLGHEKVQTTAPEKLESRAWMPETILQRKKGFNFNNIHCLISLLSCIHITLNRWDFRLNIISLRLSKKITETSISLKHFKIMVCIYVWRPLQMMAHIPQVNINLIYNFKNYFKDKWFKDQLSLRIVFAYTKWPYEFIH